MLSHDPEARTSHLRLLLSITLRAIIITIRKPSCVKVGAITCAKYSRHVYGRIGVIDINGKARVKANMISSCTNGKSFEKIYTILLKIYNRFNAWNVVFVSFTFIFLLDEFPFFNFYINYFWEGKIRREKGRGHRKERVGPLGLFELQPHLTCQMP